VIKKIRHFEIIGDMEKFKNEWFESKEIIKDYQNLIQTHILSNLGRELRKKETKLFPCARIYYDENNKMAGVRIYYQEDLLCSHPFYLEPPVKKGDVKEKIKERTASESCNLQEETTFLMERFDTKSDFAKTSGDLFEIKEKQSTLSQERIRTFKKIPTSPYDFYILDPEDSLHDPAYFCKPEQVLYKLGYKLIEDKYVDIDGVVVQKTRMIYNVDNLLTRKEIFIETPWREFICRQITEWDYNLEKHLVLYKTFHCGKNKSSEVSQYIGYYELNEKNCLRQHRKYRSTNGGSGEVVDEHTPAGMTLVWKVHYKCDNLGRVIECQVENLDGVSHFIVALRKELEYDSLGRIFRIKAYNEKDQLVSINSYEYLDNKWVRRNCWCDRNNKIPLIESLNATCQCGMMKEIM